MRRTLLVALCFLFTAAGAAADIIVLKSGRKISATKVEEEGDRVYYETPSGRLSFPKSAVERIERGGSSAWGGKSEEIPLPTQVLPEAAVADPSKPGAAVAYDTETLAKLDAEAQSGNPRAMQAALHAHFLALQAAYSKGNLDEAITQSRRALMLQSDHYGALLITAYLYLRKAEYTQALDFLERARRVKPDSPDVAAGFGWAYYRLNKIDLAVKEWKRSLELRPDANVQRALEKAQRDQEEESSYKENESRHFNLRYNGASSPALARDVLRTLEAQFREIESALNFSPPESIAIILYTDQAFVDVTRAPSWAGALNDGRIRVPVQGLAAMTPELAATLKHELVHSFVFQKTRERCPVWLNEGIAQFLEGKRSDRNAAALVEIQESGRGASLAQLEGSWIGLPPNAAAYAYAYGLAAVEYIVAQGGMGDIERLLERLRAEPPSAALKSVLRSDYADLDAETVKYLRKTYVR